MHLARTSISTLPRPQLNAVVLTRPEPSHFVLATDAGFELWQLYPLRFVLRRELPGSLSHASCYLHSSLFFLVGGGTSPVYAPNKVVLWDESRGAAVVELEFRERVLGLESRRGLLAVVFLRRVVLFEIDEDAAAAGASGVGASAKGKAREGALPLPRDAGGARILRRAGEWPTFENPNGLIAMSSTPGSSFVAIPGRQAGHVHLLHVHPVPASPPDGRPSPTSPTPTPPRSQILIAHTSPLTTLACTPSGALVSTTSDRGTLVRVFDGRSSALVRELRRGADRAVLRQGGVAFSRLSEWVGAWSDKGTIHAFSLDERASAGPAGAAAASSGGRSSGGADEGEERSRNRPSTLSKLLPYLPAPLSLPKYFLSEWSHATYALPSVTRHSQTLASLGATLARGAAGAASGGGAGPGERERLQEADEEDDERCVLAWVEVDVAAERERERLRVHRGRLRGAAGGGKETHAKVKHKHHHHLHHGQPRRASGGGALASDDDDDDDDDDDERPLHSSSLPAPAPAPAIVAARARPFGAIHTAHRRDTNGRPPGAPRRSHSTAISGDQGTSGFRHHSAPHAQASSADAPRAAGGGPTEHQLVALTFSGGFYRLALPSSTVGLSTPSTAAASRSASGGAGGRARRHDGLSSDDGGAGSDDARSGTDGDGNSRGTAKSGGGGKPARGLGLAQYRRFGAGGWGFVFGPREDGREWNEGEW